jgi:formylglycine-generating enzyme required for sulfatase activity
MIHARVLVFAGTVTLLVPGPVFAVELSVWALQDDLRAAAGDPETSLPPTSIAYNPTNGKLLIACAGSNGTIFEWEQASTNGVVLVPRSNWGFGGGPSPFASVYVPGRGRYLVQDGGTDNVILDVVPGVPGQTPSVFVDVGSVTTNAFPAGGMPQDGDYAYYKSQITGIEQTIHRFTLVGTNGEDEEYIPKAAFDAWESSGPSLQFGLDSADELIVSLRTPVKPNRGLYRWDPDADTNGAFVPIVQEAQIKAHTGQDNTTIYGLGIDPMDNMYFYDIYAAAILKVDRTGRISTFVTNDAIREFMNDPEMSVWPQFMAVANNLLIFTTGNTSGHILAARIPLEPEMVTIPGTDYEVNGPTYTYEIGKYEITNAQYCVFLNDAEKTQQTNPTDPRCTHMWFEPASGDVYMTDVTGFPSGSEWYDRTLYKTSDFPDSKIKYNAGNVVGSRFYVLPGFDHHPVGTVSWFGAAKFCNWLTIDAGMDVPQICYHEGTSKYDWYAITASDWSANGLLDEERLDLVRNYRGYRLPMDGVNVDAGTTGVAHSWNIDANPYNEWYKAAAFDPNAPDTVRDGPGDYEVVQPDHWIFGYGADTNTNADANLANSGDPFAETTPVGWYDGINVLLDGTPTNDTRNRYGLYDMCGNMAEWINDTALEYPWDSTYRGTRGGRWVNSDPKWATNSVRVLVIARYYAENNIGLRLVRSPGYGDFDADGNIDLDDFAFFAEAMTGPAETVSPGLGYEACDYNGDARVDLLDFARFQIVFDAPP